MRQCPDIVFDIMLSFQLPTHILQGQAQSVQFRQPTFLNSFLFPLGNMLGITS